MSTFEFDVPLRWSGRGDGDPNAKPIAWLAADGKPTGDQAQAARFRFRLYAPMGDLGRVEAALDRINGGIEHTIKLQREFVLVQQQLRARFELALWPEGRPEAITLADAEAQETALDELYGQPHVLLLRLHSTYAAEVWPKGRPSPASDDEAAEQERAIIRRYEDTDGAALAAYEKLFELSARQQTAAEWAILREQVPPGWEDIATKPDIRPEYIDAVARAYRRAKLARERETGK